MHRIKSPKPPSAIAVAGAGANKPDELVQGLMLVRVESQYDAESILQGPGRILARELIAQSITMHAIGHRLHSKARTTWYFVAWYEACLVPYLRGWVQRSLRRVFDLTSHKHRLRSVHTQYSSVLPERG